MAEIRKTMEKSDLATKFETVSHLYQLQWKKLSDNQRQVFEDQAKVR